MCQWHLRKCCGYDFGYILWVIVPEEQLTARRQHFLVVINGVWSMNLAQVSVANNWHACSRDLAQIILYAGHAQVAALIPSTKASGSGPGLWRPGLWACRPVKPADKTDSQH